MEWTAIGKKGEGAFKKRGHPYRRCAQKQGIKENYIPLASVCLKKKQKPAQQHLLDRLNQIFITGHPVSTPLLRSHIHRPVRLSDQIERFLT